MATAQPLAISLTLIVSVGGICMKTHSLHFPPLGNFQSAAHWARNPFSATRLPFPTFPPSFGRDSLAAIPPR